ncbi:hypothetical protein SLE2022_292850 [Rubroshorea leprosula]
MNPTKCAFGIFVGKFLGFLDLMLRLSTIFVPIQGRPLKVYLSTFNKAVSALVAQDDQEGKEQLVYYVSQNLKGTESRAWVGVVLRNDKGHDTVFLFKLDFQCTNNTIEYEAYLIGLTMAKEASVQHLKIIGDLSLILGQVQVYDCDAILPDKVLVPTARILAAFELDNDADICGQRRIEDLESIEALRQIAQEKAQKYRAKMTITYNYAVNARVFTVGQMVFKAFDHVRKNIVGPSKFAANWDGLFIIAEAHDSGYYRLKTHKGESLSDPVNAKWLKPYYC